MNAYYGRRLSDGNYAVGYIAPEFVVPPGGTGTVSAALYVGPKVQKRLDAAAPNLSLAVDYGILWWLSVPLFLVLDAIHSVVKNWGVAIVLLTICVKILLYPLASRRLSLHGQDEAACAADEAPARAPRGRSAETHARR